ncbi:MAG: DUF3108 domain-containing protein [Bacteroidetes bacterium]|nr:MAG: DUF3108 domain-containing protein [Bacteroidota bacterium]
MGKKIFISLLLFLSVFFLNAQLNNEIPNSSFKDGESLKYQVHFGWIVGGTASLNVKEIDFKGKKIFYTNAKAKSIGLTDKIYKVRDTYSSFIDAKTGKPIKSIRDIRESNYRYYNEVYFFQDKVKSTKSGEHKVPENMFDVLSAFYYARRALFDNLKEGDVITLNTFFEDDIFPLEIRYKGVEEIYSPVGKIKCLKFNPIVEPGRIFDSEDDMKIWISNDKNHVPIRVQFDLIVGSLKCDLIEYNGLKNDFKFD